MIKFDVLNRFSGGVQFTAEIDCEESEATSIKLGLAVRWGVENRANLVNARLYGANLVNTRLDSAYFVNANLEGAYFANARLDGARLDGARLVGARLVGARLDSAEIVALIGRTTRSDGYEFFGWRLSDGRLLIRAGCQTMTLAEFRERATGYGDAAKRRETTDILDFIEKRAL